MNEKQVDEEKSDAIINKVIDFLFSDDKRKYLLALFIIGFLLRFIVASNVSVNADEMLHGTHAINIISSGVINIQDESPAWFYLTDISYKIFGVHAFSGRFLSILFGALTILLIYAFSSRNFGKKIGLMAAALLTFSAFTLRYSLMEMDIAMMFFVLLSFYYFDRDIREKKVIDYQTSIFMGVAILVKPIAITFLASYILYFVFFVPNKEKKNFIIENKKRIFLCALIILFFAMPVIAYNIILYSQKGITDVIFVRFFHINPEVYSSLQGYDKGFDFSYLISNGIMAAIKPIFFGNEPIIFIFGLLGLYFIFSDRNYEKARFFAAFHAIPLIFLMGTSLLNTHFVSFIPLFCLSSAIAIERISGKIKQVNPRKIIIFSIAAIAVFNLFYVSQNLTSTSGIFKMREYAIDNIGNNDVVVVDSRIYRGRIAWMFNDKNYIEASYFRELMNLQNNMTGKSVPMNVYFVECVPDDCGWGTIKNQPEFNASMEQLAGAFANASKEKQVIYGGGGYEEEKGEPYFMVYKTSIVLKPESIGLIKNTHDWFYYPVRWEKDDWYDKYRVVGLRDTLLNGTGKLALWAAVIIGMLSIILVLKEVMRRE